MGFILEGVLYITVTSYLVYEGRRRYQMLRNLHNTYLVVPEGAGAADVALDPGLKPCV